MKRFTLASFDAMLFGSAVALMAIGIMFIYSSGINASGVQVSREFLRQIVWALTGIGLTVFLAFFSYTTLRMFSLYLYAGGLFLLLVTLIIGREVNGARSWLGFAELGIQPAEFAKLATILFLATYLAGIGNGVRELPRYLLGLLIALLPMGLIIAQPDIGEALAFIPIFLLMAFIAGAQARHLLFLLSVGVLGFVLAAIPTLHARSGASGASLIAEQVLKDTTPGATGATLNPICRKTLPWRPMNSGGTIAQLTTGAAWAGAGNELGLYTVIPVVKGVPTMPLMAGAPGG